MVIRARQSFRDILLSETEKWVNHHSPLDLTNMNDLVDRLIISSLEGDHQNVRDLLLSETKKWVNHHSPLDLTNMNDLVDRLMISSEEWWFSVDDAVHRRYFRDILLSETENWVNNHLPLDLIGLHNNENTNQMKTQLISKKTKQNVDAHCLSDHMSEKSEQNVGAICRSDKMSEKREQNVDAKCMSDQMSFNDNIMLEHPIAVAKRKHETVIFVGGLVILSVLIIIRCLCPLGNDLG